MAWRRVVGGWIEAVLPAVCCRCEDPLAVGEPGLCGACRAALVPLAGPRCPRCAGPVDEEGRECLGCLDGAPPQAGTVAWGPYEGALREAVLALKHGGHDELAGLLGRRLAARVALEPWADGLDVVTAVPSHPFDTVRRGWVASELLARVVAASLDRPYRPLLRRRGRGRQARRTLSERGRLPARSFVARRRVEGAVLVVDDVHTTGATVRRASAALLAAGASAVYGAPLAWTEAGRRGG